MLVCWFLAFYVLQVVAAILFKHGADRPQHFWMSFGLGNLLIVASVFLCMKIYTVMQVNLAGAIAGGGAFIAGQLTLMLVFRERLTVTQYAGLLAVAVGMALVGMGRTPELRDTAAPSGISVGSARLHALPNRLPEFSRPHSLT
jgi:multidrug transporter EmrE-like cation transporter